jgi:hypothetical protein
MVKQLSPQQLLENTFSGCNFHILLIPLVIKNSVRWANAAILAETKLKPDWLRYLN